MRSKLGKSRTLDLYLCSRGCEDEVVNDFCHTPLILPRWFGGHFELDQYAITVVNFVLNNLSVKVGKC